MCSGCIVCCDKKRGLKRPVLIMPTRTHCNKFGSCVTNNISRVCRGAKVKDPDGFIATQVKNYGPVFQMNYFGRKTVIVGGADGVLGFTSAEKEITKSALPDTFSQLHTAYGTMNQAGKIHKSSRVNLISAALCEEAFDAFLPVIRRRCVDFLDSLEFFGPFLARDAFSI